MYAGIQHKIVYSVDMAQVAPRARPNVDLPRDETIYIYSRDEALGAWLSLQVAEGKLTAEQARKLYNDWKVVPERAASYFSTTGDLRLLYRLGRDLDPLTSFYVKEYGGKLHIVLEGNARLKTVLTGTKYGVANGKVVIMGLGYLGAVESIRGGGILTAVLVSAVDAMTEVLSDSPSLIHLIGTLAVDVAKVAISTAASLGAVSLLYGAGVVGASLALGPLAVAIIVGLAVGVILDYLDDHYKLKERFTTMLGDVAAAAAKKINEAHEAVDQQVDAAKEGLLDAAADAAGALLSAIVDEIGRRFVRFVSRQADRLIWYAIPRF